MSNELRAGLWGADGRMGRAIADAIEARDGVVLAATPGPDDDPAEAFAGVDVIIDFTSPGGTRRAAVAAAAVGAPLVSGTTGLDGAARDALARLAAAQPVVHAPNMSQGVTLLFHLAARAAELLGTGFDAEIVEMHHRRKADAPSGTGVRLAEVVARAKGLDPASAVRASREGMVGARPDAEVGVVALRGGTVVGEHTLVLAGAGERVELTHRAEDRGIFARGAVRAATWIVGRPPGLYDMGDVLGVPRP